MVESEDEGEAGEGEAEDARDKKASPPPTKKAKRDKEEEIDDGEALIYISRVIFYRLIMLLQNPSCLMTLMQ